MSKQINWRRILRLAVVAGGIAGLALAGCNTQSRRGGTESQASAERGEPTRPPNLVFVFPDQMRAHAQGFMNEDPAITPNLDKLAAEGIVFRQAVANYPVCSPYRGMLMTGKYPHANGVYANCNSQSAKFGIELAANARCWSDVLKNRGYSLGYIGKWHLDAPREPHIKCSNNGKKLAWNEWCPAERRHGFDFWYAYGTYDQHLRPMYWTTDAPRDGFRYVDHWGPEHEADTAIKYIHNDGGKYREDGQPFALVVSMNPPHTPYNKHPQRYHDMYDSVTDDELFSRPNIPPADEKWGKHYRKHIRNYLASVTGVDDQFGRIVRAIDEAGLGEDTIVVFTSDHGNCLGIHDRVTKNNHYEESMRIPLIVRWSGTIEPRHDDLLISVPDLYPTLLDLMGLARDIPADVQGSSHAQVILTGKGPRPQAQLYLWAPKEDPAYGRRGVRTLRYTLVTTKTKGKPVRHVLYDNIEDKYQMQNIADEEPETVSRLTAEHLVPWLKRTNDPWLGM